MPKGWQLDISVIGQPVDWLGLNYYTRKLIAPDPAPGPMPAQVEGPLPKTQMGWEIYPEGLEFFLTPSRARIHQRTCPCSLPKTAWRMPMYCERHRVEDDIPRTAFVAHLQAVQRAIAAGAPVQGYFYWSLLDNYEWSRGL
jgi:beta-glucosidase